MTGFDLATVRDKLLPCFNPNSFDEFLLTKLNKRRADIVPSGGLRAVILEVLQIADEEGWDALLIARAAEFRPLRLELKELAILYGKTLVGQFKASAHNEHVREAYRELGLAPQGFPTEAELGGLQRLIDPRNAMVNMAVWLERAVASQSPICRVEIDNEPMGTGFLVGPNAVLTNHHVLKSVIDQKELLSKVVLRFDYKQLRDGTILSGTLVKARKILDQCPATPGEEIGEPEKNDPTNEQLDYALIETDGAPGDEPIHIAGAASDGPKRGWLRVPAPGTVIDPDPFSPDMPVLIAQHPLGQPLSLAIEWVSMIGPNVSANRVKHRTNTQPGSSGSPCFDRNWNLIALHHYGDTKYVKSPRFNQAVPIAAICQKLRDRGHAVSLGGSRD